MRVSFRNQYSTLLSSVQDVQSRLMDLNAQASSQKRINKPSDDPVGTARVLDYRTSLASIDQYRSNINTAKGWLSLADETMLQTSTVLTTLQGLAEQGATGTMTQSDREATAFQVRQLFNQLITLANTRYEGNSIFGGHKFDSSAYEEGLMAYDQTGASLGLAEGQSNHSIIVQFLGAEGSTATVGTDAINYRYSSDGGKTWSTKTLATTDTALDLDGVRVNLATGYTVDLSPDTNATRSKGSWLTVAPTAVYMGDHESQSAVTYQGGNTGFTALPLGGFEKDVQVRVPAAGVSLGGVPTTFTAQYSLDGVTWTDVTVSNSVSAVIATPYGGVQLMGAASSSLDNLALTVNAESVSIMPVGTQVNAVGKGVFGSNVLVRIDEAADLAVDGEIKYSYSTDGGVNWSAGHKAMYKGGGSADLLVPGGKVVLSERAGNGVLAKGAQLFVHPQTATHRVEISDGQYVQLNNVGADLFGGYYGHGTQPIFSDSGQDQNIMVAVGKLLAALENNDQQGCGEALDRLKSGQEYFMTQLASVGARENRLDVADTVLSGLQYNETERLSTVEDIDLASLMTELTSQQMAYEAVLKSSSLVMKMSLVDYI